MKPLEQLIEEYSAKTAYVLNYEQFNRYANTHHSCGIEGSSLSWEESCLLLDEQITPKGKALEHSWMEIDHFHALKHTLTLAKNKEKLHSRTLQDICAMVVKNTRGEVHTIAGNFDPAKGDFRLFPVHVGKTSFAKASKIPQLVKQLVEDINAQMKKVKHIKEIYTLAFYAHYHLVNIHPFIDGNGRSARLLMNYIQTYFNTPWTIVFQEDRLKLYLGLIPKFFS